MRHPKNDHLLNELLKKSERLIDKDYLGSLCDLTFCPAQHNVGCIRLLEIEILTEPTAPSFFTFVFNAIGEMKEVFGYILKYSNRRLSFYIGLKTGDGAYGAMEILKNGLINTYPQSKFRELSLEESTAILEELFEARAYQVMVSVMVVPDNKDAANVPINQRLVELMGEEDFTALFLASPMARCKAKALIRELQDLYTALSSFASTNYNFSHSFSKNNAAHVTKSTTENCSTTCTETKGAGRECSNVTYALITPGAAIPLKEPRVLNMSIGMNKTRGTLDISSHSAAKGETEGCSDTKTNLHITSTTVTDTEGVSFSSQNKEVMDLLEKLEERISRLTSAANSTLFCFGAYFLSGSQAAGIRAAYTYLGLAKDTEAHAEESVVTAWEEGDCIFPQLIKELRQFNHLSFALTLQGECVTTSAMITSEELLNTFYFPYPNQ